MNEVSGSLVFWILVPLFVAVGLSLFWFSKRCNKMIETFAKMHQLRMRAEFDKKLQETLDSCFSLKDRGLARIFDRLSSLVGGDSN